MHQHLELTSSDQEVSSTNPFKKKKIGENHDILLYITFALAGFFNGTPYNVMMLEIDVFDEIYPSMNFAFYYDFASYLNIPFALYLTHIFITKKVQLHTRLQITIFFSWVFFTCVALITVLLPPTKFNFWLMIFVYLLQYIFHCVFQGFILSVLTAYHSFWSNYYLSFIPVIHLCYMGMKEIVIINDLSNKIDFAMVWGTFFAVAFLLIVFLRTLSKRDKFEVLFPTDVKNVEKGIGGENLYKAFKIVKYEVIGHFLLFLFLKISLPGIIMSSNITSVMSPKTYIVTMNLVLAIYEMLGRISSFSNQSRFLTKMLMIYMVVSNIFLIYQYFTNLYIRYPSLCFLLFCVGGLFIFAVGIGSSYFIASANKKGDNDTKDVIGSLMINSLLVGIGCGHIISATFPSLKSWLNQDL